MLRQPGNAPYKSVNERADKETTTPRTTRRRPASAEARQQVDEQAQATLRATEEVAARVMELLTKWEQSLASSETSLASLREAIGKGEGSVATWQAKLASAEEALETLKGTLASGRVSLGAWQATIARGEASVTKAAAQVTDALQSLANVQEVLAKRQEEFAGELRSGREALAQWQNSLSAGMDGAAQWRQSAAAWQQSLAKWTESSTRLLAEFSKLIDAETARRATRRRVHPVLAALLLVGILVVGAIAGYNRGRELYARIEAVERPVVPQPDSPQADSPHRGMPPEAAPTGQQVSAPTAVVAHRAQVGAFRQRENAEARVQQLEAAGFKAVVRLRDGLYKVQVGDFRDRPAADALVRELRSQGYADAFVTQEELASR